MRMTWTAFIVWIALDIMITKHCDLWTAAAAANWTVWMKYFNNINITLRIINWHTKLIIPGISFFQTVMWYLDNCCASLLSNFLIWCQIFACQGQDFKPTQNLCKPLFWQKQCTVPHWSLFSFFFLKHYSYDCKTRSNTLSLE